MKLQTKPLLYSILVFLFLALPACGQGAISGSSESAATPTPSPTPEQIQVGESSTGSTGSNNNQDQEETADPPTEPTLPPETELDTCLIGTWRMDHEAFRQYLIQSMNISDQAAFEFGEIEGDFEMVIAEDVLAYISTEPLRIPLSLIASGVTLTTMDMVVEGAGDAYWITYEGLFIQYGQDYNFFGEGLADVISTDIVGQAEVRVSLTPSMFVSMASFTNVDITHNLEIHPEIENYAVATYTCEGDVFTYQFGEYESVWLRQ